MRFSFCFAWVLFMRRPQGFGWACCKNRGGRALLGAIIGIGVGFLYTSTWPSVYFLATTLGMPLLLGGLLAVVLGANREDWLRHLGLRLVRGLLAGFIFSVVCVIISRLVVSYIFPPSQEDLPPGEFNRPFFAMLRIALPVSLGAASMLFFPLLHWASARNLTSPANK